MRLSGTRFLSVALAMFVLLALLMFPVSVAGDRGVADISISEAESSMASAYAAVLDVENVEGDVSGLVVSLNEAAELLSEAHMAYDNGDFDEAAGYAESTKQLASEAATEADSLRVEAAEAQTRSMWINLVISAVAVAVVVVGGVVGYRAFKSWYFGRLSEMEPEVVGQ